MTPDPGGCTSRWLREQNASLKFQSATADVWVQRAVVMAEATETPLELGAHRIAKNNPLTARLVTVHCDTPRKPSQKRGTNQKASSKAKKYRKLVEEPWLLVTSLSNIDLPAASIVSILPRGCRSRRRSATTRTATQASAWTSLVARSPNTSAHSDGWVP
jgi:hypothetical protein